MKLDYIPNINTYKDDLVRLYDFDKAQAIKFRELIQQYLLYPSKNLELNKVKFIEARNCSLTLRMTETDEGITSENKFNFYCDLTKEAYEKMLLLLEPFCNKETKGYQYLYIDIDNPIDFLFSPAGTW